MGSHFSAIGFPVRTYGEFEDLMARALEHGECIETRRSAYVRWSLGAGPELWAQEYENGEFGLVPHFAGEAIMRVGLTERIERPEAPPLDDAFYGWADPEDAEDMESGLFPLVFDVPDYVLHQNLSLPVIVEARISAFAHELTAYSGEEEFLADQEEPKFSPEFFIPSGTFKPGGETMDPPEAYAICAGRVLDCSLRTNPATGTKFWWAKVKHYGGEMDVAADPEDVEGHITDAGTVKGSFWLSGRPL